MSGEMVVVVGGGRGGGAGAASNNAYSSLTLTNGAAGTLTAGGAGLSINARVAAIEELAAILRGYTDKLFSKCLKKIEEL